MQENFDRMMDSVGDAFRKAGKKDVREWAKRVRGGVKEAKVAISELGEDKGPLGTFVRGLATAQHLGAQAFLPPSLQTAGLVMGQMVKKLGPLNEQMKALGINFTSVGGLLTGAVVGVGLFSAQVVLAHRKTKDWGRAVEETATVIADDMVLTIKKWGGMLEQTAQIFADFDWANLFAGMGEAVSDEEAGPIGKVINAFKSIPWKEKVLPNLLLGWNKLWGHLQDSELVGSVSKSMDSVLNEVIKPMLKNVGDFLVQAILEVPWGKIGSAIASGMAGSATNAVGSWFSGEMSSEDASKHHSRKDFMRRAREESQGMKRPQRKKFLAKKGQEFDSSWKKGGNTSLAGMGKKAAEDTAVAMEHVGKAAGEAGDMMRVSWQMGADANNSMMSTYKDNHENSINTIVGTDMEKTVLAVEGAMQTIEGLFYDAWLRIGEGAILATGVIDSSGVMRKLAKLTQAKDELNQATRDVPNAQVDTQRDLKIRAATGDQAIHNPEWYKGSKGFERLFTVKMDRLIAAVAAGGSAGGRDDALSREILDKMGERTTGGRKLISPNTGTGPNSSKPRT